MSYLFVLRSAPDIDHMAPVAWKFLEQGHEVHVVLASGYDPGPDHRLELLRGYPKLHLHEVFPGGGPGRAARAMRSVRGWLRSTLPYAVLLLARKRVTLVAVDWGDGLPPVYERLRSVAGLKAVLRSLARSLLKQSGDRNNIRGNFVVAGQILGVPTICLPHGLSIKLDAAPNRDIAEQLEAGSLDWSDRNRFAAYVFNTEHHRRWFVDHASGDPDVMQTWGSVRWAPEWFELNRRLSPPYEWPSEGAERLKVVFMLPKWANRVHAEQVNGLVKQIQALEFASLAVMGHPRPDVGGTGPLHDDPDIDWTRVHDVSGQSSVSLIEAADVVIDVASSIDVEVVMQGKVLINPVYLHELTTLFDTIEGVCVIVRSPAELADYLTRHVEGDPHVVPQEAYDELVRQVVYGSHPEPFDVLDHYYRRVSDLATAGRGS